MQPKAVWNCSKIPQSSLYMLVIKHAIENLQ